MRVPILGRCRPVLQSTSHEARKILPVHCAGKDEHARIQSFSPRHGTAIHVPGFRDVLDDRQQRFAKGIMQRTAPRKLQGACGRIKDWIRKNRHLQGINFIKALNRRLRGHFNYYGVVGNSSSLWRFYNWAIQCAFKWLNRRGGKRRSFSWAVFGKAIERLGILKPALPVARKRHRVFS